MSLDANGWSAIAAWGSVIAAAVSLIVSIRSARAQADMILFEREKHLYELLSADAKRANDNAKQGYPAELTFSQASNVAYALDSARNRIREFLIGKGKLSPDKYKRYFRQQLVEEVNAYFNDMVPSSIDKKDPSQAQVESQSLWLINRRYFNFNVAEDEDLEDD